MKLLDKQQYHLAAKAILELPINQLFACSVADQKVDGKIYVDNAENPTTFLIAHPYGISLLLGNENNAEFNSAFVKYALNEAKTRTKNEWLQAYPAAWNDKLAVLFENHTINEDDKAGNDNHGKIELSTRVNFRFNKERFIDFKKSFDNSAYNIVRTDKHLFEEMNGAVVPKQFWNNADDFCNNAVGFSLIYNDKVASTAFSAFVVGHKLEFGIESVADFRGMGFAIHTCTALIEYCLENDYEPVWACRLQNTNSYKLAQKLGFESTFYIPYYLLIKN
jgi:hypothetical protein